MRSDFDSDIVFANARCFHLSVLDAPCTATDRKLVNDVIHAEKEGEPLSPLSPVLDTDQIVDEPFVCQWCCQRRHEISSPVFL